MTAKYQTGDMRTEMNNNRGVHDDSLLVAKDDLNITTSLFPPTKQEQASYRQTMPKDDVFNSSSNRTARGALNKNPYIRRAE